MQILRARRPRFTAILFVFALLPGVVRAAALQVATCQFPVSGDVSENAGWIRRQMEAARAQGADIVHFSETALSGYAGVDLPSLAGYPWDRYREEFESIRAAARRLQLWVVLGAHHRLSGDRRPHNSLYVIDPTGAIVDRYDKRFCTTGDLKHYTPGDHFVTFEVKGVRCGLLTCYDIRFPELYRAYAALGVRLMFHSFHNARQKEGSVHPVIMPATAQARAADHTMFISLNNSSAPRSWESRFITPDGLVAGKLVLDEPGVMVNPVDPAKKYYDAAAPFRPAAQAGILNSGELVSDPRSADRRSP
jgi:predicted amidohydrolase